MNTELRSTRSPGYYEVLVNEWVIACIKPADRSNPREPKFGIVLTGRPTGDSEPCELALFDSAESAATTAIEVFKRRIKGKS